MTYDPLQRDRVADALRSQALAGDSRAYLRLGALRRLWRAQDAKRNSLNNTLRGLSAQTTGEKP